jgi:hypothetical protein
MFKLSRIMVGALAASSLFALVLAPPLQADPPPESADSSSAATVKIRPVPAVVADWVRANLPGCMWPTADDYQADPMSKQEFNKHLERYDAWPPWCASGDFNADGKVDYAFLVISQDTTTRGVVWHQHYIILHSSDSGYVRALPPFGDWLPAGVERGAYSWLGRLPAGEYMYRSKTDSTKVEIPHDAIRVISAGGLSVKYWLWNGEKYESGYLYAD